MSIFAKLIKEQSQKPAIITFGRFNPPTKGHELLLKKVKSIAGKNDYFIYSSQSEDPKKNPLRYEDKIKFLREMFPSYKTSIIMDRKIKDVLGAAVDLYKDGYTELRMVVGSDRVSSFLKLLESYNGKEAKHGFYNFETIEVISAGERDPDSDDVSGISASKMRSFAAKNDFSSFTQGVPKDFRKTKDLFDSVRDGMNISESSFKLGQLVFIPETLSLGVIEKIEESYLVLKETEGLTNRPLSSVISLN